MSKQNRKLFRHDGEQLGFYKKVHQNTEQKEGCSCNLYITRNEEFQFIWQKLYSRKHEMPYEESWLGQIVIEQVNYK